MARISPDTARDSSVRLSIPASPENLAVVRQVISGVAEGVNIDPEIAGDIKMAVVEACANVILHAYPADTPFEDRLIVLEVEPMDGELYVAVCDEGVGFKPRPMDLARPTQRLGLPLIASLTERFEIDTGEAGIGTKIVMVFSTEVRRQNPHFPCK